jgi:catechol 2,3-dioxygenase
MASTIDPRVDIGHVHLKVSDIDRALAFYRDVLGFDLIVRIGDEAAFLSAGGYHHHLGLNTWESRADDGEVTMYNAPLDLEALLAEASS